MIAPPSTNHRDRGEQSPIRTLQRVFRRNRWIILAAPLITLLATILFVRAVTPVYEADLDLRVDRERSNFAALDALQQLSTGSEIQTEMAELRTVRLASDVVDALELNAEVTQPRRIPRSRLFTQFEASRTAQPARLVLERIGENRFRLSNGNATREIGVGERVEVSGFAFALAPAAAQQEEIKLRVHPFPVAVEILQRQLVVSRPDREASVLNLRYEATDPELAAAVPAEVARQFLSSRDAVRKQQARSAVGFLTAQIDTLSGLLRGAEAGLLAFREGANVVNPSVEAESHVRQLADWQADRESFEAERTSIASVLAEIDRGDAGRDPNVYRRLLFVPAILKNPAASVLISNLNQLENQRLELRDRRKDADPEYMVISQRIRDLDNELQVMARTYVQSLTNSVASLDQVLARFSGQLATIPAKEMELARRRRQAKISEDLYTTLQVRLKDAQIAAAVDDPSVRVIDPPVVPTKPIRPNVPLSIALALMLGFGLGVGIAFAREQLDTTIGSRDELQAMSGTIPVLGQVPRIPLGLARRPGLPFFAARNGGHVPNGALKIVRPASGAVAEAYRTLRTNIAFTQPDRPAKVLVVTSALPGEGKSTSAYNLAATLAQQGLRVALIDADMRRGRLNESFDVPAEPGLSNVLLGRVALADALQSIRIGDSPITFLPLGTIPPNPAELLASDRVALLFGQMRPDFEAIIVDTPPLNVVTDAAILSTPADGVLMVARSGVTERLAYRHALEQLEAVHARVIGCMLNDVEAGAQGYYGRGAAAQYFSAAAPRSTRTE